MKFCRKCQTSKSLNEFYIHKGRPVNKCKECYASYYRDNAGRTLAKQKEWKQTHRDRIAAHRKIQKERTKGSLPARARIAVYNAIYRGKIVRPSSCEVCMVITKPEGHHYLGYKQEHWLDIRWLCFTCHRAAHT